MARIANPVARWGKALMALVCVLAVLLAAVPCAMAAPATPMATANMTGMDCAHCCESKNSVKGPALCCVPDSQPAELAVVEDAAMVATPALFTALPYEVVSRPAALPRTHASPPLSLRQILRI